MSRGAALVGTVGYPVRPEIVHAQVDIVELTDARRDPPRLAAARRIRDRIPAGVAVSVQLPSEIAEGGIPRWDRAIDFAAEVRAVAAVLIGPQSMAPGSSASAAVEDLLSRTDRRGIALAWEPRGPWEIDRAADFAARNDLVLAVDPLRDPAPLGKISYFRLGPFSSMGSRMGAHDLERIAEAAEPFETALCVFDTPRALDDARGLRRILAGRADPLDRPG